MFLQNVFNHETKSNFYRFGMTVLDYRGSYVLKEPAVGEICEEEMF